MEQEPRSTGVVRWFSDQKGFGFIAPEDGSADLFVHQSSIKSDGYRTLKEGDLVEFIVSVGENNKTRAIDVTGPDGAVISENRAGGNFSGGRRGGFGGDGGFSSGWKRDGGGDRYGGGGNCYNCGGAGHMARDCVSSAGGGGGRGGGGNCYSCGQPGSGGNTLRFTTLDSIPLISRLRRPLIVSREPPVRIRLRRRRGILVYCFGL